jgi:hypothetical protein
VANASILIAMLPLRIPTAVKENDSVKIKKINVLTNVTEFYSKGFNVTYPPDTHQAGVKPGTWRAGSQGWWVFLKPLPPGEHTIFYNIRITPTGALTSPGTNPHFADITYKLQMT